MASRIFQHFDDTPSGVSRSVQPGLTRRYTAVTKYGLIVPNFVQYMYPGESMSIRPTSFIKLPAPYNRPQLSRVRFVQRFYQIDLRTLWLGWEEYIKGTETMIADSSDSLEVPYIVNCVVDSQRVDCGVKADISGVVRAGSDTSFSVEVRTPREMLLSEGYPLVIPPTGKSFNFVAGIHELGDYLDCAIGTSYSNDSLEAGGVLYRHAFDFAAYQLIYSFGFRNPLVQRRIDDFYQMSNEVGYRSEFPKYTVNYSETGIVVQNPNVGPVIRGNITSLPISEDDFTPSVRNWNEDVPLATDKAESTDRRDINRTSWESVEHFPLKAGANMSMLAFSLDSDGFPKFQNSAISLYRMRYANWTSDRFITATLSPQEGDEAQIPVSGSIAVTLPDTTTVTLTGLEASIPSLPVGGTMAYTDNTTVSGDRVVLFDVVGEPVTNVDFSKVAFHPNSVDSEKTPNIVDLSVPAHSVSVGGSATGSFSQQSAAVSPSLYVSPSDFRFYMQMQKIKEMQQQTDNRYKSYMHKFFGSRVPDEQLDRPKYLGGYVQDLDVDVVTQSSSSVDGSPLGSQAGTLASGKSGHTIRVYSPQHSIVMGVCFIMPDSEYTGGQNREFVARDRLDWMLPQFANISKQAIYNYELGYTLADEGTPGFSRSAFGYEPPYNYLRWSDNRAVGDFRDTFNSMGNYEEFKPWIVTRDFGRTIKLTDVKVVPGGSFSFRVSIGANVPTLSDEFLSMRYGVDDSNFSVNQETFYPFILDSFFDVRAVRKIPTVGVPRI